MSSYIEENICLEQAMTMDINYSYRNWETPGLHVPFENLPSNTTNINTTVSQSRKGILTVRINFTIGDEIYRYVDVVGMFSELEELKENFPNLFNVPGTLEAFG